MLFALPLLLVPSAQPASGATPGSSLVLDSQSPAFVQNANGVNLAIGIRSPLPASTVSIEVTLFSTIVDRYTFRQSLGGSLPSLVVPLSSGTIPLDTKGLHWTSGRVISLHLLISAPDLTGTQRPGTAGVSLSLPPYCASPGCGGVYPLQVSLLEGGARPLASFTTYVILTPPSEVGAGTHPLRFAWVLPLGSSPAISTAGAPLDDPADLGELETIESALGTAPSASVSLEVFPQFVESLELQSNPEAMGALAELKSLASPSGQVDLLPGTFVPLDPDALVASGLSSVVSTQLARGREVLSSAGLDFDPRDYAVNGHLDASALDLLLRSGVTRLVLPSSGVQPLPASYSQWTPTTPFLVPGSAVEGVASDSGLEAELASSAPPALKAQEILSDLSIQYFDNTGVEQGMVLESSLGTPLDGTFLRAFLTGLSQSRIVHAVSLDDVFDTIPPGSSATSPDKRLLSKDGTVTANLVPSAPIDSAQQSLAALDSVLPAALHPHGRVPLTDLVLMSEAFGESATERSAYLSPIFQQSGTLARLVSLPFGHTITMTSLRAKIPITIVSVAKAPFWARLSVDSNALGFPDRRSWRVRILPRTNIVPIVVTAKSSGDFTLQLTLSTTSGFTMQSGTMTIRSTAISGVAVVLSIGAAAFLIVWWLRSILTKRRKKHRLRGAALAAGTVPGEPSGA